MKPHDWLTDRARAHPDRPALITAGATLTYAELDAETDRVAKGLADRGIGRGDEVAIALPPGREHAVLVHALIRIGAVAVPCDPAMPGGERDRALAELGPTLVVDDPAQIGDREGEGSGPASAAGVDLDLDDTHCRIRTGGTSGARRWVPLTYGNHLWSAVGSALNLGVLPGERWLCCLPFHHVAGLAIVLRSAIYGTAAIVHESFDAERVADSLAREGVTLVSLVATQLERLLAIGAELSRPRAILLGGGPLPAESLEEAIGRGARIAPTYGLTEAASQVTTMPPEEVRRKPGSVGPPLLSAEVRVEGGEICVRGPTVAPGAAGEDGWLRTGDLGHLDDDGFLYVSGRADDVIVSGGENVSPEEVEEVLREHPAVADAAVVGRPDPEWQQAVTGVVVLRDGAPVDPDELRAHCASRLSAAKVPKRIEFVAQLPRSAAGKLLRGELR